MLVARQGGKASAQGGSESATGLLACGGAQGAGRAGGAVCAVGHLPYCARVRVAEGRSQPLVLSTGLQTHVFHERAKQSEARGCGSRRSKLL